MSARCIHEWDFTHEPQKIFCAKCCMTLEGRQIINYLNKLERSEIEALEADNCQLKEVGEIKLIAIFPEWKEGKEK